MERFFQERGVRDKEFFGFDWQFALTDDRNFPDEKTEWHPVQLPHDWSVDYPVEETAPSCGSGGYARTGIGWYKRSFRLEKDEKSRYALLFECVYMNCDVWLNGEHIGGHVYGYTSFELELGQALKNGDNELLVRVDNSRQPGSRWYTGSGITRDVYITRTNKLHIRTWSIFVTTPEICLEQAMISVQADVIGAFDQKDLSMEITILDPDGQVAARSVCPITSVASVTAQLEAAVCDPKRWDVDSPVLYTAVVQLKQNEETLDEVPVRFGIREIAYDPLQGFLLNGRKLIMKGVCLHHDGGCVGAAVPPAVWARRLRKLKDMGCNALRCSHNPPDPALLDLADEMGFVVMDEAFDEWHNMKQKEYGSNTHESRGYSEWFDANAAEDLKSMVERDRNHPSIVMWSIGNEVREQGMEDGWKYARMLAGLCHGYDPTRLITQACDQMKAEPYPATDEFLDQLDIVGVNYVDRWRERTETFFDEEKREHPEWLLVGTEDIAVNGPRCDYKQEYAADVWGPKSYYAKMLKAEKLWKFVRTHPYVIGTFMWTGVDYLGECSWPSKSSDAGIMDTCGYEKDGYYFYRSVWGAKEPMIYLCPHLNLDLAPGTIYPLICYTNCSSVELLVDGVSYGRKAYEFPNQGMVREWGTFDHPFVPITTNDLHLSWDIPYGQGEVVAVGYDVNGKEILRKTLKAAGAPAVLEVKADRAEIHADGRDVVQIEIALKDESGNLVPHDDRLVTVEAEGGELLGMDNGRSDDQTLYRAGSRMTYGGLAYAIVRAPRECGQIKLCIHAKGLAPQKICVEAK